MTINLVKLCVGAETVEDLRDWVKKRVRQSERDGAGKVHHHVTRMHPRRDAELASGGSIYWVIKGNILVRQRIIGFEKRVGADQIERTAILLKPNLILTEAQPRRAFQGWRYLSSEDAPKDLPRKRGKNPPPELSAQLADLGLL
ncbi:MAG: DUF1489 domain-containing protein [Pseudomonadota bacterium]